MVDNRSYRDQDGKHMADERFQLCLRAWYHSIRRVEGRVLGEFQDMSKLEFTREELALVDLEVRVEGCGTSGTRTCEGGRGAFLVPHIA
jgi:hypothetical protein